MSNENLDQDALATEEMLKMFEGVEVDDALIADETHDETELLDTLTLDESSRDTPPTSDTFDEELEALSTMELAETTDTEVLEMADNDETTQLLEGLDSLEEQDELADLSFDEDLDTAFTQASDDEFPPADLADAHDMSDADSQECDDLGMADVAMNELAITDEMAEEVVEEPVLSESKADHAITPSLGDTAPIAEHLQAVVANAIQALQDWMQLRQEGEHKGPQQSLAQLDVLLDTVTNQQQQLAEQLANSPQKQLAQLSAALGTSLATPQTLGWTEDDWRIKAQQVAEKTDDISQRNAKIRQELSRL